jgi:signal transduction histidine kinase
MKQFNPSRYLILLLLCGIHWLASNALAADKVLDLAQPTSAPISLTEYFSVLEDPARKLTLAQVQTPDLANRFKGEQGTGSTLNFGMSSSAYWLRLHLRNTGTQTIERWLEISYASISTVEFYQPTDNAGYHLTSTGNTVPFVQRPYRNRHHVYVVKMPPNTDKVFYLHLHSNDAIIVPARLWEPEAFHHYERNDYIAQALYFGIVAAMLIFNLLIYLALRDRIYLLYVFFVFFLALSLGSQNGLAAEFLWSNSPHWAKYATGIGYTITVATLLVFMRQMLNTEIRIPRFDWILKFLIGILLLLIIGFAADQDVMKLAALMIIVCLTTTLGCSIYCACKRQRSAYFFVAAFTIVCFGGLITTMRALNVLPSNFLTINGLQIGSAIEMLVLGLALADRFNQIRKEKENAQSEALLAEYSLVENLRSSERVLEERVEQRTAALSIANMAAQTSLQKAEAAQQEAERSQQQTNQALLDLTEAQAQLIESEKMGALGQLVTNVAHEINTPIGAVKASNKNVIDALEDLVERLPKLFQVLDANSNALLLQLINHARTPHAPLSSREERASKNEIIRQLKEAEIDSPRQKAEILVQLRAESVLADYLPLLRHPEVDFILSTAYYFAIIINNSINIDMAADRITKIVSALKALSPSDSLGKVCDGDVRESVETVLTLYQHQLKQGITLEQDYQATPLLPFFPEELNQVWSHLFHNALQAMNHQGTLTISIRPMNNEVVVSITDSGCGIPETLRERIFDAFFSTQPIGEGRGLGLYIARKIIDKHGGRILVKSEVGVGSMFSVYLPLKGPEQKAAA